MQRCRAWSLGLVTLGSSVGGQARQVQAVQGNYIRKATVYRGPETGPYYTSLRFGVYINSI